VKRCRDRALAKSLEVADYHARRFVQAGVRRVIDLGCGIGSDSMAFLGAGLEVVAVDVDPVAAEVAQANLAGRAEVICAAADEVVEQLITPGVGLFCDPARRDDHGRVWRVEDFEPRWPTVMQLLDGATPQIRQGGCGWPDRTARPS
jgi:SAM-dependent methyltransferase